MSDKAAEPKKKGKMPIVIVALVIGGGGFFMMKGKKAPEAEPDLALGEIIPFPKEFLVNLSEDESYLKTEIAIQVDKHAKKDEITKALPAIQSAFVVRMSGMNRSELITREGKLLLKRKLAEDGNKILAELAEAAHAEEGKKKKKKKKGHDDEESSEFEYPEFDSDTGPILKVYFTSFASQ